MRQLLIQRRVRISSWFVVAAIAVVGGCSSSEQSIIDLSVSIDPGLSLDKLAIRASAPGKPTDLSLDAPVTANPVRATIYVSGLASGAVVTVEVSGIAGQATIVIARASTILVRGQHVPLTMVLAADCAGVVACDLSQTCDHGRCIPIAVPVVDAGTPDGAAGTAGAGVGGHAGTGGSAGKSGAGGGGGGEAGARATGGQAAGGHGPGGAVATGGAGGASPGAGGMTSMATGGKGAGGKGPGGAGTGGMTGGAGGMTGGTGGMTSGTGGNTVTCTATQHKCSGVCVDNDSIDHCGATSCAGCATPSGATATCDGTACGFDCGAQKKCADARICIPTSGCCTSAECTGGGAGQVGTCDAGTHQCSYACPSMTKSCTSGATTACIALDRCCTASDCIGPCQTCNASHACVALTSQDDPTNRCTGTCDAAGACKSKLGQGCSSGSSCGSGLCSHGYCCVEDCLGGTDTCAGSCAGSTSGQCIYPTGHCTPSSCPQAGNVGTCNNSGNNGLCYYPSGCP